MFFLKLRGCLSGCCEEFRLVFFYSYCGGSEVWRQVFGLVSACCRPKVFLFLFQVFFFCMSVSSVVSGLLCCVLNVLDFGCAGRQSATVKDPPHNRRPTLQRFV